MILPTYGYTHVNWKVVLKVLPDSPVSDPLRPSSTSMGRFPVKVQPQHIKSWEEPVISKKKDKKDCTATLCYKNKHKNQNLWIHCYNYFLNDSFRTVLFFPIGIYIVSQDWSSDGAINISNSNMERSIPWVHCHGIWFIQMSKRDLNQLSPQNIKTFSFTLAVRQVLFDTNLSSRYPPK